MHVLRPRSVVAVVCLVALILAVGLWPTHVDAMIATQLLEVFRALAEHPETRWITYPVIESAANVLLFVPTGFFLARTLGYRWGWLAAPVAIGLSIALELAQLLLFSGRTPALGDVIANGAGAVLGATLGILSMKGQALGEQPPPP